MQETQTRPVGLEVDVTTEAITPQTIRTIRLADGDHKVSSCRLVQFAVGEAHSPIAPAKLFPTLKYIENGKNYWTPLSSILGFSTE